MPAGLSEALLAQLRADAAALTGTTPCQHAEILAAVAALEQPSQVRAVVSLSLEEWVEAEGLDPDFYTQAELVDLYQQAHATPEHVQVSALQIEPAPSIDQLIALRTLEALMARAPSTGDQLDAWLAPRLVARIGGGTVDSLSRSILSSGRSWVKSVRGVGLTQARLIASWLDAHLAGGHLAALARPGRPGRPCAHAGRPTLSAMARRFGAEGGSMDAEAEVVEAYLSSRGAAARMEVERFFIWMCAVDRTGLAEANDATLVRYLAWAGSLDSRDAIWVSRQPREHSDSRWAPFRQPLSEVAARRTNVRLRALLRKLRRLESYREHGGVRRPSKRSK